LSDLLLTDNLHRKNGSAMAGVAARASERRFWPGVLRESLDRAGSETSAPPRHNWPVTQEKNVLLVSWRLHY